MQYRAGCYLQRQPDSLTSTYLIPASMPLRPSRNGTRPEPTQRPLFLGFFPNGSVEVFEKCVYVNAVGNCALLQTFEACRSAANAHQPMAEEGSDRLRVLLNNLSNRHFLRDRHPGAPSTIALQLPPLPTACDTERVAVEPTCQGHIDFGYSSILLDLPGIGKLTTPLVVRCTSLTDTPSGEMRRVSPFDLFSAGPEDQKRA